MRAALLIARNDLRRRLRDRSALVLGVFAPLLIATVMSFALGGATDFNADVAYVDQDGGSLATAFAGVLDQPELREVLTVTRMDEAEARRAIEDGDASAAFVVPVGFTDAALGGDAASIEILGSVDGTLATQVSRAVAESFVARIDAIRLSVAAAIAAGAPAADVASLAADAAQVSAPAELVDRLGSGQELEPISYFAPAMATFFLLFSIGFGSRSYFGEQQEGTLDRLLASPTPTAMVLLGKMLAIVAWGSASMLTIAVVTSIAFGADWGPPWAAAALGFAMVLAVVSTAALVTVGARTARQAEGLSSVFVFGLALLGGNFLFLASAPEALRRLALLTPNGWALRGFTDLGSGAAAAAIRLPLLAIGTYTVLTGAVAVLLARRRLVR